MPNSGMMGFGGGMQMSGQGLQGYGMPAAVPAASGGQGGMAPSGGSGTFPGNAFANGSLL